VVDWWLFVGYKEDVVEKGGDNFQELGITQ
jgi:hypothetical protein